MSAQVNYAVVAVSVALEALENGSLPARRAAAVLPPLQRAAWAKDLAKLDQHYRERRREPAGQLSDPNCRYVRRVKRVLSEVDDFLKKKKSRRTDKARVAMVREAWDLHELFNQLPASDQAALVPLIERDEARDWPPDFIDLISRFGALCVLRSKAETLPPFEVSVAALTARWLRNAISYHASETATV